VAGTPWKYAVDLPLNVAIAPATDVVLPFIGTGLLIATVGVLLSVRFSRRITAPLADLTAAAEALARGDRDVSLAVIDRKDEIGRLARVFSTMSANVQAVRDRLEAEVGAGRGELHQAVERLKALDEELRRNERFTTLGRLSGSVGHELRNPLGVMSTVVLLMDEMPDASPKLKDYARLLREQIRLSDRIISDLLERARSGAPVLSSVDVSRLIDEVLDHAAVPPSIRVERQHSASRPSVILDRDQVGQILWNLVTNAIQSMSGSPGVLKVAIDQDDTRLRIDVCDSGPGVPACDRERIFEPTFTTKPKGVGLGLPISRAFARANGGDLILYDGGEGACFRLEVPIRMADEALGQDARR
jgi:signal transduction histidine kinase